MNTLETAARAALSRRTLLTTAGALGVGLALPRVGSVRSAAEEAESIQDIINIAATAEAMAVTVIGEVLASDAAGGYDQPIPGAVRGVLRAVRAADQAHLDHLQAAGATPLTLEFTVPVRRSGEASAILSDAATMFSTAAVLKGALVAAYLAAARTFAAMGEPALVGVAYRIGAVEAEHRVLAARVAGIRPPNNVAFAEAMFSTVGGAAQALTELGWLGGRGPTITYPGPGEIDSGGLSATEPEGPTVECASE